MFIKILEAPKGLTFQEILAIISETIKKDAEVKKLGDSPALLKIPDFDRTDLANLEIRGFKVRVYDTGVGPFAETTRKGGG